MNKSEGLGLSDANGLSSQASIPGDPLPRADGAPLPNGASRPGSLMGVPGDSARVDAASPQPGRTLAIPASPSPGKPPSKLHWAANALRGALPLVQRVLPLLDGNIASAVSNILAPPPSQPQAPVNLEPLQESMARMQSQHRDLRNQIAEQNTSLKKVEGQLEMLREATDRNTLEQQELLEDLKTTRNKVNTFALLAFALLAVSVVMNVILYIHMRRVLP